MTKNQLDWCSGPKYDEIKQRISEVEDQTEAAEENDNAQQAGLLSKYKTYLERYMKCEKIMERANDTSDNMTTKARNWPTGEAPEFFHISAASYMNWIKKDKILFSNQEALLPLQTRNPSNTQVLVSSPGRAKLQGH